MEEQTNKDLFGETVTNAKRTMSDYFGVPPFSILNTVDGLWQARKRRWNNLINDKGQAREGVLGDKDGMMGKIANGTSILDACLAETMLKWFTEENFKTFDPFAGDTVFGFVSGFLKRPFVGIELREEQATFNQEQTDREGLPCKYICDSSENMDNHIQDNSMDFIFSCPPYADLEVYSDLEDDLSTMSHDDFFSMYKTILTNTFKILKNNRFAVVVTSEVRDKKTGEYIMLVPHTIGIMKRAGYMFYNDIILVNSVGSLPLRSGKAMNSGRKVGRRHQNVLVFYKGDAKKIKENFNILIPKNEHYEK